MSVQTKGTSYSFLLQGLAHRHLNHRFWKNKKEKSKLAYFWIHAFNLPKQALVLGCKFLLMKIICSGEL